MDKEGNVVLGENEKQGPGELGNPVQSPVDHQEDAKALLGTGTALPTPEIPAAPKVKLIPKRPRRKRSKYLRAKDPDPLDDKDQNRLRMMHTGRPCPLCANTLQAEEVEKAYYRWWPVQEIAEFFGYKRHVIKAHADALGWTKKRAESTPEIYERVLDELLENFDASQIPQKHIAELIVKLARHQDRLQGKITHRVDINEHKSVVFLSVPLPGGAPPLLPDKEAPRLLSPSEYTIKVPDESLPS